ncbi:MAG: ORF6N domain-containing protein [Kiritimatiellaeota bacterium]|nr:ORF6N domain-containing protein [Kiritimatiellota bacterium]
MKADKEVLVPAYVVEPLILCIRSQKVILDADLARIYGVATKVLNQAVKRNADRFPPDFLFQFIPQEVADMQSQLVTASSVETDTTQPIDNKADRGNRSQIVTSSRSQSVTLKRGQNIKYLPYAFTEHGAIMAATVLNSPRAVQMSVFVVRAFIKLREQLLNRTEMEKRLAEIEKGLLSHDAALRDLYARIRPLLLQPPDPPKKSIGFQAKERRAKYRTRKGR